MTRAGPNRRAQHATQRVRRSLDEIKNNKQQQQTHQPPHRHCLLTHSYYCRVLPRGKCGCRRTMEFLPKESNPSRGHQRFREKTDETAPLLCGPRIRNYLVLPPIANRRATQAALLVLRPHPPIPGTILLFGKKAYIPKIRASGARLRKLEPGFIKLPRFNEVLLA